MPCVCEPPARRSLASCEPLQPGDLLMTGTPDGVGAVERGDVMRGSIARLGEITVNVAR